MKQITYTIDLDENGHVYGFSLPTGELELYSDKARILISSLEALGFKVICR